MNKPNLFIVGAPKCGTTALCEYLRSHPSVFMSTPKEPHYFSTDYERYRRVKTIEDYNLLFSDSTDQHKVVGEASVFYLISATAAALIQEFNPNAKVVVMLRKPVDLIYSLHAQLIMSGDEIENDFENAWRLQSERASGKSIPNSCREPAFLQYKNMGQLGDQVEALLKIFPRQQVKVILYEDFSRSPRDTYAELLEFLDIPNDNRKTFETINPNQQHRFDFAANLLHKTPQSLIDAALKFRNILGIERLNILRRLRGLNTITVKRPPLSKDLVRELNQEFATDIRKLERLLGINLDHWTFT